MTLEYAVNKCKYFCFANSLSSIKDQLPEDKRKAIENRDKQINY